MSTQVLRYLLIMVFVLPGLTACGGGGGSSAAAGGTGGTGVVSTGVMTKGSVILNGVRFEDTTANISIDDTPKIAADLRDGMVVTVLGTVNADDINGTAQQVEAQIEVRGTPTSVDPTANPQSLVVLGQIVFVDDQTVYSNLAGFGSITTSTLIEVHGLRDTTGRIRATRIEANPGQMGDNSVDEIRGVVTAPPGLNPIAFSLGSQAVNASGAVITPVAASYQNGSVVEVHCILRPCVDGSGVFQASRIEVESAEDSVFQPGAGQRFEVEGLISGFGGHPGSFFVAGTPVTTTSSTRFQGGIADDLADNVKVEAEGTWNGLALIARKIEFKRSVIRLQGIVTESGASAFTMDIAGRSVNIETDDFTEGSVPLVSVPPINSSNCVQVRGQRKAGIAVVVTAGEIRIGNCSNSSRPVIQAPVEVEEPEDNITLLGFLLDVSNPTDNPPFADVNDQPLSRTAFFNAVTPAGTNAAGISVPGTLVKVIFEDDGSDLVRQVELED